LEVYLIQHAKAKPKEIDPEQPLTDEGRRSIEKVARYASKLSLSFGDIYHSGKLRAFETAKILADKLGVAGNVKAMQGLGPSDNVRPIAEWIRKQEAQDVEAITIVGHLPFLDRLASLLVAGDESLGVVSFHNAAIVRLATKSAGRGFAVDWILTPELVA